MPAKVIHCRILIAFVRTPAKRAAIPASVPKMITAAGVMTFVRRLTH